MMVESIISIIAICGLILYGCDYMHIWERETKRWNARQALRSQTWDEIEEVEYRSTL